MVDHRGHRAGLVLLALVVALLGACTSPGDLIGQLPTPSPGAPPPSPGVRPPSPGLPGRAPLGIWGVVINGKTVQMLEVSDREALLEFPCAHGSINEPLALDAAGNFAVSGTYTAESGAAPAAEAAQSGPARYSGWTDGHTMQLTVVLVDGNVHIGDYTLTFSPTPLPPMPKCM